MTRVCFGLSPNVMCIVEDIEKFLGKSHTLLDWINKEIGAIKDRSGGMASSAELEQLQEQQGVIQGLLGDIRYAWLGKWLAFMCAISQSVYSQLFPVPSD